MKINIDLIVLVMMKATLVNVTNEYNIISSQ